MLLKALSSPSMKYAQTKNNLMFNQCLPGLETVQLLLQFHLDCSLPYPVEPRAHHSKLNLNSQCFEAYNSRNE